MATKISLIYPLTESRSRAVFFFFRSYFLFIQSVTDRPQLIDAHIRLNSALIVGCLRVFLAALSKVFWKASLRLVKEEFSQLAKSAASNIFWYFVSFRATRVKD